MTFSHVKDAGRLEPFLSTNLKFRAMSRDNSVSEVDRLAATDQLPLRFSKRIQGRLSRLITYENNFLLEITQYAPDARTVKRLSYSDSCLQEGQYVYEIVTVSAGVDMHKWYNLPVYLAENRQSYANVFCHPGALLQFVRGTLLALQSIHRHGIIHCDFKEDQLCIPHQLIQTDNEYIISPHFDEITLIDFGNALWHNVPTAGNPLPFDYENAQSYQAKALVGAARAQSEYFKTHKRYNFELAISSLDYGIDLYSFSYLLNQMLAHVIGKHININDLAAWSVFKDDFQSWINELSQYTNGVLLPYDRHHHPHQSYLNKIDAWIGQVEKVQGYSSRDLTFTVQNQAQATEVPTIRATPLKSDALVSQTGIQDAAPKTTGKRWLPWGAALLLGLGGLVFVLTQDRNKEVMTVTPTPPPLPKTDPEHKPPIPQETTIGPYRLLGNAITDTQNQLIWRRCLLGQSWDEAGAQCTGEIKKVSFSQLNNEIEAANQADPDGHWRLPTILETHTLVHCSKGTENFKLYISPAKQAEITGSCAAGSTMPALDSRVFGSYTGSNALWTSSRVQDKDLHYFDNKSAGNWVFDFERGNIFKVTHSNEKLGIALVKDTPH